MKEMVARVSAVLLTLAAMTSCEKSLYDMCEASYQCPSKEWENNEDWYVGICVPSPYEGGGSFCSRSCTGAYRPGECVTPIGEECRVGPEETSQSVGCCLIGQYWEQAKVGGGVCFPYPPQKSQIINQIQQPPPHVEPRAPVETSTVGDVSQ
jgi:hypothetical protein